MKCWKGDGHRGHFPSGFLLDIWCKVADTSLSAPLAQLAYPSTWHLPNTSRDCQVVRSLGAQHRNPSTVNEETASFLISLPTSFGQDS